MDKMDCDQITGLVDDQAQLGVKELLADASALELDQKLKVHESTIGHPN